MPFETDSRLRSYLNTNQEKREQLCLALLQMDSRFTEVKPRHPRGGRDGGRDIEALYNGTLLAFGASGFRVNANDSKEDKTWAFEKFDDDLASALDNTPKPAVFVFFTNVEITVGERDELKSRGLAKGLHECDIIHRERMRISLDSTKGLAIRFQYLDIALSDAEQAAFFHEWGDTIQSVISTGISSLDRKLDRMIFLQESSFPLQTISVLYKLKREYAGSEIGHFRAFMDIFFKVPLGDVYKVDFGSSDKAHRFDHQNDRRSVPDLPGIENSVGAGVWEHYITEQEDDAADGDAETAPAREKSVRQVSSSNGVGRKTVSHIAIQYQKEHSMLHFGPRFPLSDIDESMLMPLLNASLADKLDSFSVYANEYELLRVGHSEFIIDRTSFDSSLPVDFTPEELNDPWVRIRPATIASNFSIELSQYTPRRLFSASAVGSALAKENGT